MTASSIAQNQAERRNQQWIRNALVLQRTAMFNVAAHGGLMAELDRVCDIVEPSDDDRRRVCELALIFGLTGQDVMQRMELRRRGQLHEPNRMTTF